MKNKYFVKVLMMALVITLCVSFNNIAFAETFNQEKLQNSDDYKEVTALSSEISTTLKSQPTTIDGKVRSKAITTDAQEVIKKMDQSIKEYKISLPNLVKILNENTFDKNIRILDVYQWMIPISSDTSGSTYAIAVKYNNKFSMTLADAPASNVKKTEFLFSPDQVANTLSGNGISNPTLTRIFYVPEIKSDFLYVYCDREEYFLPFTSRPDLIGLENDKLYSKADFTNKMDAIQNQFSTNEAESFGGFPTQTSDQNNIDIWYILGGVTLLLVLSAVIIMHFKKHKTEV